MEKAKRAHERRLTRRINRIERQAVLMAGRSFDPGLDEAALVRIEARLQIFDAQREMLIEERTSMRRGRRVAPLPGTQSEQIAGKGKRTDIMSAEIPSGDPSHAPVRLSRHSPTGA